MKKISKSLKEWKTNLTEAEYAVTREKATEAPYSGELNYNAQEGVYVCKCCGNP